MGSQTFDPDPVTAAGDRDDELDQMDPLEGAPETEPETAPEQEA